MSFKWKKLLLFLVFLGILLVLFKIFDIMGYFLVYDINIGFFVFCMKDDGICVRNGYFLVSFIVEIILMN